MRRPNNLGDAFPFEECNSCYHSDPYITQDFSFNDDGVEYVIKCRHERGCEHAYICGMDYGKRTMKGE